MTDVLFPRPFHVSVTREGEARLAASLDRLAREDYATAAAIAESEASDWPGDLAGRLLLARSRQLQSGYLSEGPVRELFEATLVAIEDSGYFGELAGDIVDEQQVACHGWVVSGLLQFGAATGDPRALPAAERVVDGLLLPAMAALSGYPLEREPIDEGAASGTATAVIGGWRVSTDTWCVLLALGALVPVFEATRRSDVEGAIRRLLAVVSRVDLVEQRAQLHASLAGARNVARFAELTGDEEAAGWASRVYDQYVTHGRTLHYATYNWFGRPESWTEPCAIVDSIGLAFALNRLTGKARYLDDIAVIEENAMGFAERADGGFGLDSIPTEEHPILFPIHPDARWCCTMRGALGLVDLRDRSYDLGDDGIDILLPRTATVRGAGWDVRFEATGDELVVTVGSAPDGAASLRLRGPRLAGGGAELPFSGGRIRLAPRVREQRLASGGYLWFDGPALLVTDGSGAVEHLADVPRDAGADAPRYDLVHAGPREDPSER